MDLPVSSSPFSPLQHLVSGSLAGLSVDLLLYPLDTIKTRLQSRVGFFPSGGFTGLYHGVPSVLLGSAPSSAAFFLTYETMKRVAAPRFSERNISNEPTISSVLTLSLSHAFSASIAEIVACLVRVPMDNVKQKRQTGMFASTSETFWNLWRKTNESSMKRFQRFYTGYGSTIIRDVPFAFIQFPLYEGLKAKMEKHKLTKMTLSKSEPSDSSLTTSARPLRVSPSSSSPSSFSLTLFDFCVLGVVSGGVAAFFTCPLDVIKTRIMLGGKGLRGTTGVVDVGMSVYAEGGILKFFSGIGPRVTWIGLGGAIFFAAYENSLKALRSIA